MLGHFFIYQISKARAALFVPSTLDPLTGVRERQLGALYISISCRTPPLGRTMRSGQ
jgi:hypothetical protein